MLHSFFNVAPHSTTGGWIATRIALTSSMKFFTPTDLVNFGIVTQDFEVYPKFVGKSKPTYWGEVVVGLSNKQFGRIIIDGR